MAQPDDPSNGDARPSLLHRPVSVPVQIAIGVLLAALALLPIGLPNWPATAAWRLVPLPLLSVAAAAGLAGLSAGLTAATIVVLYYLTRFAVVRAIPANHELAWLCLLAVTTFGIALLTSWPRRRLQSLQDELNGTQTLLEGANRRLARALETEQLRSYYDHVTDLPSRRMVIDRFSQGLAHARRGNTLLAVLLLDLDHFREVNDRIGHDAGDEVLRQVGQRLAGVMRQEDTVGRLDSDAFVVLLTGIAEPSGVTIAAQKIADVLEEPFVAGNPPGGIGVSAHLGAAIYPQDGQDWDTLYRLAKEALSLSKAKPEQTAAGNQAT